MTPELREHLRALSRTRSSALRIILIGSRIIRNEPDREAQIMDTERSLALSRQLRDLP